MAIAEWEALSLVIAARGERKRSQLKAAAKKKGVGKAAEGFGGRWRDGRWPAIGRSRRGAALHLVNDATRSRSCR